MRRALVIAAVIAVVLGGLFAASKKHAPKPAPPTTEKIWRTQGIPVGTARVIRGDMEQAVEVTGDINALSSMMLSAKVSGRVAAVYAREGDRVSKGMTVVLLDQQDALANLQQAQAAYESAVARLSQAETNVKVTKIQADAAIEQAQASLAAAEARLAVAKNPSRSQERMMAENNLASAKANLDNAAANYKRNKQLLDDGAISASAFDVIKTQHVVAEAQYASAKEQLSLIKEGGRTEDITSARAQADVAREGLRTARANASQNLLRAEDVKSAKAAVRQAAAVVALARQQVSYTYVRSPISGELASRLTEPGQVVAAGQGLGQVVDLSSVYFKGEVSESRIEGVRAGQPVRVGIDALPGRTFRAVVERLYPAASTLNRSFSVQIAIQGPNGQIKPGMFARGEIITGYDRNVVLVPKDAMEERRGVKMVFTIDAKHRARRHDIQVVRTNTHYVEIEDEAGFGPGDPVVTSGRQNLQDRSLVNTEN